MVGRASGARAPLVALLVAMAAGLAAAQLPAVTFRSEDPFPINYVCPFIADQVNKGNEAACKTVNIFISSMVNMPDDSCANTRQTGYGRQMQPLALDAKGKPAPKLPLVRPPGNVPAKFGGGARAAIMDQEGSVYNWLWQVIRNIKFYWPCSKALGGSLDGYLVPEGWALHGTPLNQTKSSASTPGIFTRREPIGGVEKDIPLMVSLVREDGNKSHLVIAVRGSNTKFEWATNFEYNTRVGHSFLTYGGKKAVIPGEIHTGFSKGLDAMWEGGLRDILEQQSNWTSVTITGHSQGGAIASLLAFAAGTYLRDKGLATKTTSTPVSLVMFGSPHVGSFHYQSALYNLVNIRRIGFENDPFALLPCTGSRMPLCNNTVVPTRRLSQPEPTPAPVAPAPVAPAPKGGVAPAPKARKAGPPAPEPLWVESYTASAGEIMLTGADMPVQKEAWSQTSHVMLKNPKALISALHSCSYVCAFRSKSLDPTQNTWCLLHEGTEAQLKNHTYCPDFPLKDYRWPVKAVDRQLFPESSVFPDAGARPPMFKFRTYNDTTSWKCYFEGPVARLNIVHKPLPGVTPEMMVWLYDNLENGTSISPIDGKTYPNFLLYHPRDHIKHWINWTPRNLVKKLSASGLARADAKPTAMWQEVQAFGCTETGNASSPYKCPSGPNTPNPGVTKATDRTALLGADQVNSGSLVDIFSKDRIDFAVFYIVWVLRTSHKWFAVKPTPPVPVTTTYDKARILDHGYPASGPEIPAAAAQAKAAAQPSAETVQFDQVLDAKQAESMAATLLLPADAANLAIPYGAKTGTLESAKVEIGRVDGKAAAELVHAASRREEPAKEVEAAARRGKERKEPKQAKAPAPDAPAHEEGDAKETRRERRAEARAARHHSGKTDSKIEAPQVPQLQVVSDMWIGIGGPFGGRFSPRIQRVWTNGLDLQQKCQRQALHFIEEMGTLPEWLPQAYCTANPTAAPCIARTAAN